MGLLEANPIKLGIYPMMLSGYFDFAANGKVMAFKGDLPFCDYWTNLLSERDGFFSIYFADHPIAIGDTWSTTNRYPDASITLDAPLILTNEYRRSADLEDATSPTAVFKMKSVSHLQNLGATLNSKGQRSNFNISKLERDCTEICNFDKKRQIVSSSIVTEGLVFDMDMLIQGNPATTQVKKASETKLTLIDQVDAEKSH